MNHRWILLWMLMGGVCAAWGGASLVKLLGPTADDARLSAAAPNGAPLRRIHVAAGPSSAAAHPAPGDETATPAQPQGGVIRIPSYPQAITVGRVSGESKIQLCQACLPRPSRPFTGVDSYGSPPCGEADWVSQQKIPWEFYAQGEYIGPYRPRHVPEYRLRVDDQLDFVYRLTRIESSHPYELNVGDRIRIESLTDANLDRELVIQPDGTITLRLLGQVRAARRTVEELRSELEQAYKQYYKVPSITVTPIQVNTKLEDLRAAVDGRFGAGGQNRQSRVTPEGTIQLPGIGNVPAQGLTLDELKREVDARYAQVVDGVEVTPVLTARAPRFVYVLGEVRSPGRFDLTGPTTLMASISLAGGWNVGGNLREIVVFRRAADWHLIATKIDIQGAVWGKRPSPADEIWLRDTDIVVVPKMPILRFDDVVSLYLTRGLYGLVPISGSMNVTRTFTTTRLH